MKNLLLAIVALTAFVAAEFDYGFPEKNIPDGFPLARVSSSKCDPKSAYHELRSRYPEPSRELSKNITTREYYGMKIDLGTLENLPGDFAVSFAVKLLNDPVENQVLFHAGSADMTKQIELRFGGPGRRTCNKGDIRCGPTRFLEEQPLQAIEQIQKSLEPSERIEAVTKGTRGSKNYDGTLRFRVSPDAVNGGQDSAVWISAAAEDRVYAGRWFHVVAIHEDGCKKSNSGLTLFINGMKTYESDFIGRDKFDTAFLPPNGGKATRRENTFLGSGSPDRKVRFVPLDADFTCVQVHPFAPNAAEIQSLYDSADRYLQKAGEGRIHNYY